MNAVFKTFKDVLMEIVPIAKIVNVAEPWPADRMRQLESEAQNGNRRKTGFVVPNPQHFDGPKWIFRFEGFGSQGTIKKNFTLDDEVWNGIKVKEPVRGWHLSEMFDGKRTGSEGST